MKSLSVNGTEIGTLIDLGSSLAFFGNRHGSLDKIEAHFGFRIFFLKQVHGNKLVEVSTNQDSLMEADAHWTNSDVALGIYTADCLPVMLCCRRTQRNVAIHAGWRGVKSQIVYLAKNWLLTSGSRPEDLFAAIGPHIGAKSFEIEKPLGEEILKADPYGSTFALPHPDTAKCYISLLDITKRQLGELKDEQIHTLPHDTFSDPSYFSYRREKGKNRLINFIIGK